ncbi:MAG: FTR1 family protein [Candidatus Altimarinota bacterium]
MTDFIITFRETLEAALVVGIVLSYLSQLGQRSWFKVVYGAVAAAVVLSIFAGFGLQWYFGGFSGTVEEVYEGIVMLTAAALITWMVLWMIQQRHVLSQKIREKVDLHLEKGSRIGIFFLVLLSVLREGIETVLFLEASALQSGSNSFFAAIAGIIVAIVIGYLLFSGLKKVSLRHFFTVTSVVLILFAAGLVAHGVHELQEAGWIPVVVEHVWDLNPPVVEEGVYPLLHEEGVIGSLMKGVFGWNGNPSLLEVLSYAAYLVFICTGWYIIDRQKVNGRRV